MTSRAVRLVSPRVRWVAVATIAGLAAGIGVARADCNTDLNALMSKRMAEIQSLNQNSKAHGGKLDPVAACPRLRNLAASEAQVVAYMQKNKAWCGLPDEIVDKMAAARVKTAGFAAKACNFVVKMKEMQSQQQKQAQQQEPTVKLPTGPL